MPPGANPDIFEAVEFLSLLVHSGIEIACRPSVRPSVCLSVMLVDHRIRIT